MESSYVSKCAQIASVLEVSGHPKPGNVHRTQNFPDMVFEDFLLSGIAIGDTMAQAAKRGLKYRDTPDKWENIGLGELILEAVTETDHWVANNTNLGIVMLTTPLSVVAGMSDEDKINWDTFRDKVDGIIKSTTPEDAVNLYKAINIADAGGMGEQEELDVAAESSLQKLRDDGVNLFDVLEISAPWDKLSYELTHKMPVTFNIGYPTFKEVKSGYQLNQATVQTFLTILSRVPDTLISRKFGDKKAQEVSEQARYILDQGGMLTSEGRAGVEKFDQELIDRGLNPGTTADFTASSIMVSYLDGYHDYKTKLGNK
ncbi:triphosphoribosyl-dephospho-CoA synthase [Methanobacterium sp. BAmetb5]|uniref:triphosphoribosyl-dephospho-CoA synthase n=1 Tax=Methanobacterium sp. BAmetb5 TaxID=2025351 RepID=UPI000E7FD84C|nr:triphosphoribosyl-dephospho-CoA synthase [Methanobacterium sp. BAmetb5]AXV39340.1 MAG: ATP--dephospho-CoA triphosphoribosyl transferase CitG [Methanobacterium sp. BAmetb5]